VRKKQHFYGSDLANLLQHLCICVHAGLFYGQWGYPSTATWLETCYENASGEG
jgi:hypothetical protein